MLQVGFIDTVHPSLSAALQSDGIKAVDLSALSKEEALSKLNDFDGLVIRSRFKLTSEILHPLTKVKFIARAGAGMENIDVEFAENKGIKCLHAPEGNRDAVAEHAIGMLLCLFNNILRADQEVRKGIWIREGNRGIELTGKTVGVIGYGNMGSTFAKRLKGFDVKVLAYDKYFSGFSNGHVQEASREELFKEADIVSLHVPLTDETYHMVNEHFLDSFRKPIYLINTARGKVVKTTELVNAIKEGKVAGACLDVQEIEDISFEGLSKNPDTELASGFEYLQNSNKVILTPHIAGWTHESNEKIAMALYHKIIKVIKPA
jgi:D-3-phosphoglycerate dehydrogenase / 2-oxoglutarate reductase